MSQPRRWLTVVGIGDDGAASLTTGAQTLVAQAEVLVGGARHLCGFEAHPAERLAWASPLEATIERIAARRDQRVVVLASGDPLWFGIGTRLVARFGIEAMTILPAPSAFALAAARLGWSLADTETLTLHGRPLAGLRAHLAPGVRLLALSAGAATPPEVARILQEEGYGSSRMIVLEHMGGTEERQREGRALDWAHPPGADLNTIAIDCAQDPGRSPRARAPGLPDDAFRHAGKITKREVRAATLARLGPLPGQRLWDVGAGSGAVAIEWLRASRSGHAIAIERDPARLADIAANAEALGVPALQIEHAAAPDGLDRLAPPDAVFVGGGLSAPGLIERCLDALRPGGRLVANAVTLEAERVLLETHGRIGGELIRIAVSRAAPVGAFTGWRPLMSVTQFVWARP